AITLTEAAHSLSRAHLHGGKISIEPDESRQAEKGIETPVEAILIEAGLINNAVWRSLLQLHQKVRLGQMTRQQAAEEFRAQHPKPTVVAAKQEPAEPVSAPKDVLGLLKHAGIVSDADIASAGPAANEDQTELAKRLVTLGKLDGKLLLTARQCLSLIESDRLRIDRAVIALHYCQRSRVGFYQAVEELGWERP
ncbi:MAG: hypothetical protein ACRD3W_12330, partial [Terriglobales bacterium]